MRSSLCVFVYVFYMYNSFIQILCTTTWQGRIYTHAYIAQVRMRTAYNEVQSKLNFNLHFYRVRKTASVFFHHLMGGVLRISPSSNLAPRRRSELKMRSKARQKSLQKFFTQFFAMVNIEVTRGNQRSNLSK